MAMLDQDMLVSIDAFYYHVGEINWYLLSTEDMPATVMDNVMTQIRTLKRIHETANSMLEASLQLVNSDLGATTDYVEDQSSREKTVPDFQGMTFGDTLGVELPSLESDDVFNKK
jgi:hypothetical protein